MAMVTTIMTRHRTTTTMMSKVPTITDMTHMDTTHMNGKSTTEQIFTTAAGACTTIMCMIHMATTLTTKSTTTMTWLELLVTNVRIVPAVVTSSSSHVIVVVLFVVSVVAIWIIHIIVVHAPAAVVNICSVVDFPFI
jgi:hypothetical protein